MNIDNFIQTSEIQTFYISKEKSKYPYIPNIIEMINKIKDFKIGDTKIIISISFGKRMVINTNDTDLDVESFIEIVDYDSWNYTKVINEQKILIALAVYFRGTRLIDNIVIN